MASTTSSLIAEIEKINFASSDGYEQCEKPLYRVQLKLQCPGSIQGSCEPTEHVWHCTKCNDPLEVIKNDDYFYCSCGKADGQNFTFKCSSQHHVTKFISYPTGEIINHLKPICELNILVIGAFEDDTPVWLNAFINFIASPEPAESTLLPITQLSFHITDKYDIVRDVRFGAENTESSNITANVFAMGNTLIRLIDMPGIRGAADVVENIQKQFQMLLSYLRGFKELHGVCVLVKPDEPKLDVHFELCFKEFARHFDFKILRNVVFCSTNARGTSCKSAETRVSLVKLLRDCKFDITLDSNRMYSVDSDSFRFFSAINQGVEFKESDQNVFLQSWAASACEAKRLLFHFKSLEPHCIEDTISMIEARKNIIRLTKPIADVLEHIQIDIAKLNTEKLQVEDDDILINSLTTKLLDYYQIRCANEMCDKKGMGLICHENCCLEDIPLGIVDNRRLRDCLAMDNGESLYCRVCHCFWDQHLVVNCINTRRNRWKTITQKNAIEELEKEWHEIIESSVKIGRYLSKQGFMSFNNIIWQYINLCIRREEKENGNDVLLKRFRVVRDMYFRVEKMLQKAMAKANSKELDGVGFEKILKELCALEHYGGVFKVFIALVLNRKDEKNDVVEVYHDFAKRGSVE